MESINYKKKTNSYPNFLYIGASRAGSTWLFMMLRNHPQVYVYKAKDLYFFDKEYKRGINWYESFFSDASANHLARGELSHDYLFSQNAPSRIYEYYPKMKLLINLRDPIDRFISHYNFITKRAGEKSYKIAEFIKLYPQVLEEGLYGRHLNQYLKVFPEKQLCIFDFESISSNPKKYISSLFSFLECQLITYNDELLKKKILESKEPRSKTLNKLLAYFAKLARKLGLPSQLGKAKHSKYIENILFTSQPVETKITSQEKQFLLNFYKSDVKELQKHLQKFTNITGEFNWIESYL